MKWELGWLSEFLVDEVRGGMLFGISGGRSENGAVSSGIFVNKVLLGMSLWDLFWTN